ncbi:MAG: hypothetical protein E7352_03755 [Clostridiales bacterium]|nr:hypothetical protein [Clostridiales bacterium]
MKKIILRAFLPLLLILYTLLAICSPFYAPPYVVSAQSATQSSTQSTAEPPKSGTYACVLSDDAYFYLSPGGQDGVFLLPKTYYVRLLSYGENYCKVEYLETDAYTQKVTGYVRTQHLAFVDYQPKRPYLNYVFELTYRLENTNQSNGFTELTFTCAYYGDYPIGEKTWCYVLRDGEFGHVPKPDHIEFEENTEYADYLATLVQPTTPTAKQKSSSPAQIAILITLCLLVPLLAALILKSPRKPPYEKDE